MHNIFSLSSYDFHLPPELIAQEPCAQRDHSRLMVIDRKEGSITEIPFYQIIDLLNPRDHLIFNDTKVIPSRLIGYRQGGGKAEIFLTRCRSDKVWEALVRPGRKLTHGCTVRFGDDFSCEIIDVLPDGQRVISFHSENAMSAMLEKYGKMPLPPYIERESTIKDTDSYQTVYAKKPGAIAAPTAGLHFTKKLLQACDAKGVERISVTLHVGLGTFKPVKCDDIRDHQIHTEHLHIEPTAAELINHLEEGRREICIGTTACRALEAVSAENGMIPSGEFDTNIFIYPGYRFKHVKALLTNFHLPKSSLLMLVSGFAGHELIMEAYKKAVQERFRFFSYGDAMLIL